MKTYCEHKADRAVQLKDLYEKGMVRFEESDLIYSASQRCQCGAGLARVDCPDIGMRFWHCSLCLKGHDENGPHTPIVNFWSLEVKEEGSGITTRPDANVVAYLVTCLPKLTGDREVQFGTFDEQEAKNVLFDWAKDRATVKMTVSPLVLNPTLVPFL